MDKQFVSEGEIRIPGANIGGQLAMSGARITSTNGNTFNADGATIAGNLLLDGCFECAGPLILDGARLLGLRLAPNSLVHLSAIGGNLGRLRDSPAAWSPDSDLSGTSYSIDPTDPPWLDVRSRVRWLQKMTLFSRTSWQQLEQVYREHGEREMANTVAVAMRVKERSLRHGRLQKTRNLPTTRRKNSLGMDIARSAPSSPCSPCHAGFRSTRYPFWWSPVDD